MPPALPVRGGMSIVNCTMYSRMAGAREDEQRDGDQKHLSLHSLPPSSQVGELLEILKGDTNHLTGINSKKRYFPNVSHRRARDKFEIGLRSCRECR